MTAEKVTLGQGLQKKGVSRRSFLKFCGAMTAALALPARYTSRIAEAVETKPRPPVLWLEYQDCAGNSESLLRASQPSVAQLVLDVLSVDYHETIMAPAGHQAEKSLRDTMEKYKGQYIVVVEGSIPTKDGGVYCTIGGRTALDLVKEIGGSAAAVIAAGTCASYGGIPAAAPNPTGAVGVGKVLSTVPIINLPGCPMNVINLTATVVHYLTFGALPAVDQVGRPLFAYGERIHDHCERRAHYDAGQYAEAWGDEGHRKGWCLYKMGCKGPATYHNCPVVRWNEGTNWPIGAGHGCAGCSEPGFWDSMTPFYRRLPNTPGFGVETSADKVGMGVVAGVTGAFAMHGLVSAMRATGEPLAEHETINKEENTDG